MAWRRMHLWFCVGEPTAAILGAKRYRDVETAERRACADDEELASYYMFVYKDDELVWLHDWHEVEFEWAQFNHYSSSDLMNIYLHQKFCQEFQRWAISVWGR